MENNNPSLFSRVLESTAIRYLLTGGTLFVIDLAIFMGLKALGVATPLAQLVSRTAGAAVGFIGHKLFTFRNRDRKAATLAVQGTSYIAVTVFTILFSPVVVGFFDYLIPNAAPVIVTVADAIWLSATNFRWILVKVPAEAIMLAQTYVLLRLVFRRRQKSAPN